MDSGTYLGIVLGAAGAVLAVIFGLYVPALNALIRWYAQWTWRAIRSVRPLPG